MNIARQGTTRTFDRRTIMRGDARCGRRRPVQQRARRLRGQRVATTTTTTTTRAAPRAPTTRSAWPRTSTVDAVIFDGGYGTDYVAFAAALMEREPRRVDRGGVRDDGDRPGAAAPVRGRRPARPDRQLRGERDRVQHDPRPARGPRRRPRRQQPRGHQDPRHPLRGRGGAGHLRRQAGGPELRPDGLRRLVLREHVRGVRLGAADDVGRGDRPRRRGQGGGQVPLPLGQGGGDLLPDAGDRVGDQGGR